MKPNNSLAVWGAETARYLGSLAAVAFLVGHNQTAQELKCEVLVRRTGPICLHCRWRDSFCSGLGGDRDWESTGHKVPVELRRLL